MTTAIIGTGGLGSVIARQLASGGESLRLSSADTESARTLAAQIGAAAVVAAGNRDALQGAGAVILALRFTVLKSVIDEIAGPLAGKVVVVPSNPLTADAHGNASRVARVYDFWLGGKDNFAADRAVAEQVAAAYPDVLVAVRAQRAFMP
jgi:predicted dinucleotide-binding enzyme